MGEVDVSRFVEPQRRDIDRAVAELDAGRKRSHWIWYVLPQLVGLGSSPTATFYGITSVAEAQAFLAHPELGPNYRRAVAAMLAQVRAGTPLADLLGWPDDAKAVSSLTLFAGVAPPDDPLVAEVDEILTTDGRSRCPTTEAFLSSR